MLERASQWLTSKHGGGTLSNSVTYSRGATTISLAASRQLTEYEVTDFSGMIAKVESHDFVIQSADLVDGTTKLLPQPGDTISVIDGADEYVYEVQSLSAPKGNREQPYKPCDPWGHQLRVFTVFKQKISS